MRRLQSDKFSLEIILLILLPVVLCVINSNWIFNPIFGYGNSSDAWLYHGLFRGYDKVGKWVEIEGYFYYVERVAWATPGYLLYYLFPPVMANYMLHLMVYYIAIFSFFALLKFHLGKSVAFFTSLLLGTYPWFLASVGYDYLDGYAISLFFLLLYVITLAIEKQQRWLFFSLGVICMILFSLNPNLSLLLFNGLLYTLWLNHQKGFSFKQLFKHLPVVLSGLGLGAIFLSVVYFLFTDSFNNWDITIYFSRTLPQGFRTESGREAIFIVYGDMFRGWLLVPVVVAFVAIFQLLRSKQIPKQQANFLIGASVLFAFNHLYWIIMSFILMPYIIIYLYYSYTIPFTFLLLSVIIATQKYEYPRIQPGWGLLFLPLIASVIYRDILILQSDLWLVLIAGISLIAGFLLLSTSHWAKILLIMSFAIINFLGGANNPLYSERGKGLETFKTQDHMIDLVLDRYPDANHLSSAWVWLAANHSYYQGHLTVFATGYHWMHQINQPFLPPENPLPIGSELIIIADISDSFTDLETLYYQQTDQRLKLLTTDSSVSGSTIYFTKVYSALGEKLDHRYDIPVLLSDQWGWEYSEDLTNKLFWTGPANKRTYPVSFDNANRNLHFEMCVVSAFTPNFPQSVQVYLDEHPLQLSVLSTEECPYLFSGTIDATWITPNIEQSLHIIAETVLVGDATFSRELGILIDWFRFGTMSSLAIGYELDKVYDPPILPNQERVMELTLEGATVLWTGPTSETVFQAKFPSNNADLRFEMCVVSAFTPNFQQSVQVYLDEHPLQLSVLSTDECPNLFNGTIDANWITLDADQSLRIVAQTVLVGDATYSRDLGILIDWFRFNIATAP